MSIWIEWNGGPCPLPGHRRPLFGQVRYRDGQETAVTRLSRFNAVWEHAESDNVDIDDGSNDIIAYRLVEPHECPN